MGKTEVPTGVETKTEEQMERKTQPETQAEVETEAKSRVEVQAERNEVRSGSAANLLLPKVWITRSIGLGGSSPVANQKDGGHSTVHCNKDCTWNPNFEHPSRLQSPAIQETRNIPADVESNPTTMPAKTSSPSTLNPNPKTLNP